MFLAIYNVFHRTTKENDENVEKNDHRCCSEFSGFLSTIYIYSNIHIDMFERQAESGKWGKRGKRFCVQKRRSVIMALILLGLNHRTSPLDVRERLSLSS